MREGLLKNQHKQQSENNCEQPKSKTTNRNNFGMFMDSRWLKIGVRGGVLKLVRFDAM